MLKTVIHVHTNYSYDANITPAGLVATARRQGVDCVAVTDHDEIAGALAARALGGVRVIVGEEISSADGHVIGLFLQQRIPPGLPVEETADRIRHQGGVVLAPHPFATLCEDSLGPAALERLLPWLDGVEICNAQNPLPWEDARAARFSRERGVPPYVGADVHVAGYLAGCWQMLPEFDGPEGFRAALRAAELHAGRFGPAYLATMATRHYLERLVGRTLPGFGVNVGAADAAGARLPSHTVDPAG